LGDFFPKQSDDFFQIIPTTAIGKDIFIDQSADARFWPLGTSYYNLLRLLPYGHTPQAHYFLNILIFVSFILLFLKILNFNASQKKVHLYIKIFLVCCLPFMIVADTWSGVMPFFDIVYAETLLCFLFALFVFCYQKIMILNEAINEQDIIIQDSLSRYHSSSKINLWGTTGITLNQQRIFWAALAVTIAIFSTYCKEPVFVIFLIIACVNLLFAKKPLKKFDKFFNFTFIINAICFIGIYYFGVFLHKTHVYTQSDINLASFQFADIVKWIGIQPILLLCAIFVFVRVYFILFKRDRRHIFYDSLLFGAFGYCATIIALRLPLYGYYFLPPLVLFFVVLAYWLIRFYDLKKYIIFLSISFSVFSWSMEGFANAGDIFIKQHSLAWKRTVPYNILKLDMMSKYNKIVYIGSDDGPLLSLQYALKYFNSNYFHTKVLDNSETIVKMKPIIIEESMQSEIIIYPNIIYISSDKDLVANNKNFSKFILISRMFLFGGNLRYVYIYEDRL
jgi:hypothetical protein